MQPITNPAAVDIPLPTPGGQVLLDPDGNPIAILMICLGLCAFSAVVFPRLSVDTFPELTPPVLVVGAVVSAAIVELLRDVLTGGRRR